MYKILKFSLLLFLLSSFFSCNEHFSCFKEDECIDVTIISEVCGTAVMQITSSEHKVLSAESWVVDGRTYIHSFFTEISCEDFDFLNKLNRPSLVGAKFKARVVRKAEANSCVRCLAAIADPPRTKINISLMSDNCESLTQ